MALTCGSARFSALPTMAVEDYPALPELPEETGVISADLFGDAIGQVAVAAGRDDTLPMLTGIRWRFPVRQWFGCHRPVPVGRA